MQPSQQHAVSWRVTVAHAPSGVRSVGPRRLRGAGAFSPGRAAELAAGFAAGNKASRQRAGMLQDLWKQKSSDASAQSIADTSDYYRKVGDQLSPWEARRRGQGILGGLLW